MMKKQNRNGIIPTIILACILSIPATAAAAKQNTATSSALLPTKTVLPPPTATTTQHTQYIPQSPPTALPQPPHQLVLQRRWSGYTTMTIWVSTVTVNLAAPPIVTVTLNPSDPNPNPATVVVTVGEHTQTINQEMAQAPQTTQTVYVTASPQPTTIRTTSVVTINPPTPTTSTVYLTHGPAPSPAPSAVPWFGGQGSGDGLPADRPCYPGEESIRVPGHLTPTSPTQTSTLFAIALYFVIILVCWNLFMIRHVLFPFKLVVVAWHEFGHVVASSCSGCKLESVTIDPNEGGATRMQANVYPNLSLPFGYISSCLFGGLLVFCGFNTLASKIASFFLMMSLIVAFWWATGLITRLMTLLSIGLLIGFWFIDHAGVLRYFILFVGVMSSWYIIYDVMDDFVFRKMNASCPVLFEARFPMIRAGLLRHGSSSRLLCGVKRRVPCFVRASSSCQPEKRPDWLPTHRSIAPTGPTLSNPLTPPPTLLTYVTNPLPFQKQKPLASSESGTTHVAPVDMLVGKCRAVRVGSGDSAVGRMGFSDELAHPESAYTCYSYSNTQPHPRDLSITVDGSGREVNVLKEAPETEGAAQLQATSYTQSNTEAGYLCPVCRESEYTLKMRQPWPCDHLVHLGCWDRWIISKLSGQPGDTFTYPTCPYCRMTTPIADQSVEREQGILLRILAGDSSAFDDDPALADITSDALRRRRCEDFANRWTGTYDEDRYIPSSVAVHEVEAPPGQYFRMGLKNPLWTLSRLPKNPSK
ncbi:hypothetical protein PCASD_03876 [Puccinia coronata f. sp. avenae]|uniref:RING-type domain-containing protein n=1 Tax=Puccinia coronata f. sp. avenae TaxID=200324 RepID=A0A2N5V304_9BASI|nr:hypothetical protein PCASD_03876 [Puccinia coronata f. sp. avenae]